MSFTIICMKILNKIKEHLSANKNRTSHNMTDQETKFDNINVKSIRRGGVSPPATDVKTRC